MIVKNISENTSQDTLEFYFDNERRSGVTGVLDVKKCDEFYLVYFEDPEGMLIKTYSINIRIKVNWRNMLNNFSWKLVILFNPLSYSCGYCV